MSSYPLPPQYGASYNPIAQYAPPSAGAHPPMPHLAYQQMQGPSPQHQGQMGVHSTQYTNNYSFNSNSQGHNAPLQSTGVPRNSFTGFIPPPNSSFPPPPFPPIPIPSYGAFSQPPPPLHYPTVTSSIMQPHQSLPQKPPNAPHPPKVLEISSVKPTSTVATMSDLEDGELSDGESKKQKKVIKAYHDHPYPHRAHKSNGSRRDLRRDQSSSNSDRTVHSSKGSPKEPQHSHYGNRMKDSMGQLLQRSEQSPSIRSPGAKQFLEMKGGGLELSDPRSHESKLRNSVLSSGVEYSPKASQDSRNSNSKRFGPIQPPTVASQSVDDVRSELGTKQNIVMTGASRPYHQRATELKSATRGRAKDALKELYPHVGYMKLVEEGIDPSLLRELYTEMGISVSFVGNNHVADSTESPNLPGSISQKTELGKRLGRTEEPQQPNVAHVGATAITPSPRASTTVNEYNQEQQEPAMKQKRNELEEHNTITGGRDQSLHHPQMAEGRPSIPSINSVSDDTFSPSNTTNVNSNTKVINGHTSHTPVMALVDDVKPLAPQISSPKVNKALNTKSVLKPAVAKPGDKALERKDYIARMLAAKAGKPIPMASASSPVITLNDTTNSPTQVPAAPSVEISRIADERRLFVDNITLTTTESNLKEFFIGYLVYETFKASSQPEERVRTVANVNLRKTVSIPVHSRTAQPFGYAFVELATHTEAQRAISELSGKKMADREVNVQLAQEPQTVTKIAQRAAQAGESFTNSLPLVDVKAEAKKKAQTDLARQRIEALKTRDTLQQDTQMVTKTALSTPRPQSPFAQPLPYALQESISPNVQTNTDPSILQNPYFTPALGKPTFNLPGLFMAPACPSPTTNDKHSTSDRLTLTALNTPPVESTAPLVNSSVRSGALALQPTVLPVSDGKPESSTTMETYSKQVPTAVIVNEPRKRQKASDFIDSPSTRVKKTLGQIEENSVIIEISDDEMVDQSDDGCVDAGVTMDIDVDPNLDPETCAQQLDLGSGKQKAIRDLPPLTDFPARKRPLDNLTFMTPPMMQTPGKIKEPEGLKTKEKEIELMNRRIAELEQRMKSKQSASRAQTPGTPINTRSSPKPTSPAAITNEQLKLVESLEDSMRADDEQIQAQKSPDLAIDNAETVTLDEKASEQTHQETEQAMPDAEGVHTAKNGIPKQDQLGQADEQHAEGSEQPTDCDRLLATEAALSPKEPPSELAEPRANNSTPADTVTEGLSVSEAATIDRQLSLEPLQQGIELLEQPNAIANKLSTARAAVAMALDQQNQGPAIKPQAPDLNEVIEDAEDSQATKMEVAEEEQRRRRRAEIESGLPVLDAEVERTKQRLQLLKKQMDDLEREVQKGVDGRRILLDELVGLSPATKASLNARSGDSAKNLNEACSTSSVEQPDSPDPADTVHLELPRIADPIPTIQAETDTPPSDFLAPVSPLGCTVDQLSYGELAEDLMDISRSDIDEGEITDYSPEPTVTVEDQTKLAESEDFYEPPVAFDALEHRSQSLATIESQQDRVTTDALPSNDVQFTLPANIKVHDTSEELQASSGSSNHVDTHCKVPESYRRESLANPSDSDDYEPPEPETPVETPASPFPHTSIPSTSSFSILNPDNSSDSQSLKLGSTQAQEGMNVLEIGKEDLPRFSKSAPGSRVGRFTPYESPLKQFKSYRYHPDYVSEVSEGFRSLTYSHAINPDKPICRYEAGGRCNDESCESQHFRSMGLSDDMVLVQMGTIPDGLSTQEGDAYVGGLRKIIQEIRGRKVKDFNTVASEITNYRAKFLGDRFKVLPL